MSVLRCLLPLVLIAVTGCGDGRVKLPTAPVSGTVTYQGKPLGTGRIIFFHPSGQAAATDLAADGSFKLAAFQGQNQVAIQCFDPDQSKGQAKGRDRMSLPKSLIPDRYVNYSTSGLTLDVKPGEDNKAEFILKD